MAEANRFWAWERMREEYSEGSRRKQIVRILRSCGGRRSEVAAELKRLYGTSGHSLCVPDREASGGFRLVGFIDFDSKGIRVKRDAKETPDGQEELVRFTWAEMAKTMIERMENEEAEAKAFDDRPSKSQAQGRGEKNEKRRNETMTMLAKTETRALTLADYEARIHLYKEQIGVGYIGIGRTLNEAKAAQVVPHGQWEAWVTETTGLTPRQAQRCMKAATEIRDGSAMAQLEMSKALLLLGSGLDEDAQEKIAEKAADEGATVKALKEEIRQAKLKLVQETGMASEIRQALKRAEAERDGLKHQMEDTIKAYQQRIDEEAGAAYRRGMQDKAEQEYQRGRDDTVNRNRELQERINVLHVERQEMEAKVEQLRRNQGDLLAAAEEAEQRAANAEAELEEMKAGKSAEQVPAIIVLNRALGAFYGECELMPYYPEQIQRDKQPILETVAGLETWCSRMRNALEAPVDGEGAVE